MAARARRLRRDAPRRDASACGDRAALWTKGEWRLGRPRHTSKSDRITVTGSRTVKNILLYVLGRWPSGKAARPPSSSRNSCNSCSRSPRWLRTARRLAGTAIAPRKPTGRSKSPLSCCRSRWSCRCSSRRCWSRWTASPGCRNQLASGRSGSWSETLGGTLRWGSHRSSCCCIWR